MSFVLAPLSRSENVFAMPALIFAASFLPPSVGSVVFIKPGAVYGGCTSARGKRVPDSQLSPKKHTVTKVQQNRGTLEALLGDISSWVAVGSLEEV